MKKLYQSPKAQVVDLTAMEKIALITDDGNTPTSDSQWVEDKRDF